MCAYVAVGRGNFSVISCKSSRVSKVILPIQSKTFDLVTTNIILLLTINIFRYTYRNIFNFLLFNFSAM